MIFSRIWRGISFRYGCNFHLILVEIVQVYHEAVQPLVDGLLQGRCSTMVRFICNQNFLKLISALLIHFASHISLVHFPHHCQTIYGRRHSGKWAALLGPSSAPPITSTPLAGATRREPGLLQLVRLCSLSLASHSE